jgi:hypothetical protein
MLILAFSFVLVVGIAIGPLVRKYSAMESDGNIYMIIPFYQESQENQETCGGKKGTGLICISSGMC